MSAKSIASVGFLAGVISIASVGYLESSAPPPPPPPNPVVWTMQAGGPGGSDHKWLDEAHQKDLARAAARAMAESADEEAVLLVIMQVAVEQYYT